MKEDLELAKKFMLEFLPPEAQVPVMDIFTCLGQNPTEILQNGLLYTRMSHSHNPDRKFAVCAIDSFCAGFSLGYTLHVPECSQMLKHYLEHREKEKGGNVVTLVNKRKI